MRARTSELQHANGDLSASHELLRATIESTADGILVVDGDGRVAYHNARFARLWRVPDEVLAAQDAREILAFVLDQVDDPEAFVAKVYELHETTRESLDTLEFKDGRVFERFSRPLMRAGDAAGRVWSFRDVTERKRAEEILDRRARYDSLTSTLNHAAIADAIRDAIAGAGDGPVAIAMVDVDGLKAANDTYGHLVGDAVLISVARKLGRQGAVVGRYGGDEFVVVLPGADRAAAERYRDDVLRAPGAVGAGGPESGAPIRVVASIGLAVYPQEAEAVGDLIRLSDSAMYATRRERTIDGASLTRSLGGDRAAKMVGEIVPLLTSPGDLGQKMRLVAHRLSVGAGYAAVNFPAPPNGRLASSAFARASEESLDAWNERASRGIPRSIARVLHRTRHPLIIDDLGGRRASRRDARDADVGRAPIRAHRADVLAGRAGGPAFGRQQAGGRVQSGDSEFVMAVATQVTAIVRMDTLVDELQTSSARLRQAHTETVLMLAGAAEAHDHTTGRHLQRVRAWRSRSARTWLRRPPVQELGLAAVLHDIGKIRVPDMVLGSRGQLGETSGC